MKKKNLNLLASMFLFTMLTSCSMGAYTYYKTTSLNCLVGEADRYEQHEEIDFINTSEMKEMYLSLDNSSYSYTDVRSYINSGLDVPTSSVNIEEMLNYFTYDYESEQEGINIKAEVSTCPWNTENLLETIAIYAPISSGTRLPSNITFLVDVSGSMSGDDRLGLFQEAFEVALPYFTSEDKVSIVTYASGCRTLLDGISGDNKTKILKTIESLEASGSTFGSGGIQQAYKVSRKNFIEEGNNHIFIVTDGDFNVGISDEDELGTLVKSYANEGIYLSIFGVGMYNTRQSIIETIKKNGDGNCYYLDSVKEASTALEQALKGGMKILSKDTKAKVSFDEEYVSSYRVIGYENKLLTSEEYEEEDTNAGEIFEGYQVMIAFEIVPTNKERNNPLSAIEIKYKDYKTLENKECNATSTYSSSNNHIFASLVCEFGLILRDSQYKGNSSIENILTRSSDISSYINDDDAKKEFVELVKKYKENKNKTLLAGHYYNS